MADFVIPGTTPVIRYRIGEQAVAVMDDAEISFAIEVDGIVDVLFVKKLADCSVENGDSLLLQLYEDDTLQFPEESTIRTQVRIKGNGFTRGASRVRTFRTGELDREGAFDA